MITLLFWNLNKKFPDQSLVNLSKTYNIDIFIFAEHNIEPAKLLGELNRDRENLYFYNNSLCEKIKIYSLFQNDFISPVYESDRLTVRHLTLPGISPFLLAAVHFPSKLHFNNDSQAFECTRLINDIKKCECEVEHSRTIFVGDFNMNPFENGFISANGLNAVMSEKIALHNTRIVQGQEYMFFYNPMWSYFGDINHKTPGSYYYPKSDHVTYYWNIFDQVLIRPEAVKYFDKDSLKILDSDGFNSFLNNDGIPDKINYSDHLPIMFKINL